MNEKAKARRNKHYYEKYLPAFKAFIKCYPFTLENLQD